MTALGLCHAVRKFFSFRYGLPIALAPCLLRCLVFDILKYTELRVFIEFRNDRSGGILYLSDVLLFMPFVVPAADFLPGLDPLLHKRAAHLSLWCRFRRRRGRHMMLINQHGKLSAGFLHELGTVVVCLLGPLHPGFIFLLFLLTYVLRSARRGLCGLFLRRAVFARGAFFCFRKSIRILCRIYIRILRRFLFGIIFRNRIRIFFLFIHAGSGLCSLLPRFPVFFFFLFALFCIFRRIQLFPEFTAHLIALLLVPSLLLLLGRLFPHDLAEAFRHRCLELYGTCHATVHRLHGKIRRLSGIRLKCPVHAGHFLCIRCLFADGTCCRTADHVLCGNRRHRLIHLHDPVINILLRLGERGMCPLQLKSLPDIFGLSMCNQFIAELGTAPVQSPAVIEIGKFINPAVLECSLLQFFQNCNPLVEGDVLRFHQLVLENITVRVARRNTDKFVVELHRAQIIIEQELKITERI